MALIIQSENRATKAEQNYAMLKEDTSEEAHIVTDKQSTNKANVEACIANVQDQRLTALKKATNTDEVKIVMDYTDRLIKECQI